MKDKIQFRAHLGGLFAQQAADFCKAGLSPYQL